MASFSVGILLLLLTIAALLPWTGAWRCVSGASEADGRSQCADYCHGFANASRNVWGAKKCVSYHYQYDWRECHVQCEVVPEGANVRVYEYFPICQCQTARDRCTASGKTFCTDNYSDGFCCTSSERCEANPNKALRCISKCAGVNCGAHGSCVATTGKCACTDGWRGTLCATAPSECYGVNCGAHGSCSPANGVCVCRGGYSGGRCQKPPATANKPNPSSGGGASNCKRMMCRAENDETVERADASNSGGTISTCHFYFQSRHICLLYWFIVSGGAVAGIVIACVVVVVIVLVAALTFVLVRRRQASAQAESNYDTLQ